MPSAADKWRASGLTDRDAERLELADLDGELTAALAANLLPVRSLYIPYHDLAGARTGFYRVRYLGTPPGWAGAVARPQRYAQPAGTLNEAYFPRLADWTAIRGSAAPVLLTEGELKAAAATARGFPTIGLGGVDVWRSTRRGLGWLPSLDGLTWAGRPVAVVFDSDAATNPEVVRAQRQLAEALTAKGARVSIVSLPGGVDGAKQGLDDYLLTHTNDDLNAVLAGALPWDESRALWELNEEVAYVRQPGAVVELETGAIINPHDFTKHAYANRHYMAQKAGRDGAVKLVKEPLAPRWLAWEQRHEYVGMTYAPGQPRVSEGRLNTWRGWRVPPAPGSVELWHRLLDHLFGPDRARPERVWFQRWAAYPLQRPGTKLYTSVVMWGAQTGTGKTLLGYTLGRIYGDNYVEIHDADLRRNFNEWAVEKQFVVGDEVTGSEKRAEADRLKGLITQSTMRVNRKYIKEYSTPDCINYYFTSNHPDAFFLEDFDRRYFIHEVTAGRLDERFAAQFDRWYKSDEGTAALFDYLLHFDLGDFNPAAAAPQTTARNAMILDGKSDLASWVHHLLEDPVTALAPLGRDVARNCDLFTLRQLLQCYSATNDAGRVTANGLGRELRRRGVQYAYGHRGVWTAAFGQQLLVALRNADKWSADRAEAHSAAAGHFDQFFPAAAVPASKAA